MKKPGFLKPELTIALGAALALTSCANGLSGSGSYPINAYSTGTYDNSLGLDGSYSQANFKCPGKANVIPNDPAGGSGDYTVCANPAASSEIIIHGYTNDSQVCVFPANVVDSNHIYAQPDPATPGQPWSVCVDVWRASSNGVLVQFPNIQYNAVFIVAGGNQRAMAACMTASDNTLCPQYSYGVFR